MSVYRTDDRKYAYMACSAHSASVLPHVQTPITFKGINGFQSCTVAVALFVDLPVDWVPDAPRGPYMDIGASTWALSERLGIGTLQVLATPVWTSTAEVVIEVDSYSAEPA